MTYVLKVFRDCNLYVVLKNILHSLGEREDVCTETAMVFFGPVPDGKRRHQDNEGKGSWLLERLLDIMSRVHEYLRATKSHGSCCSMCGGLGGPCWWPYCSVKNGACDSTLVATPN